MDRVKDYLKRTGLQHTAFYKNCLRPTVDRILAIGRHNLTRGKVPAVIEDIKPLAMERGWFFLVHCAAVLQQREPSRTITEDAKDIVINGRRYLDKFYQTRWKSSKSRAEMYYSHLYAVTRYPVYETFICEVPNAMIVGANGLVITQQLEALAQSTYEHLITENLPKISNKSYEVKKLSGTYVSLLTSSTNNYAHWLMDCLPRLSMLDLSDNMIKVIVPATLKSYQIDSLKLLGISEDRLLKMTQSRIVVEKLILCHAAQRSGVPSAVHLSDIRNRLVHAVIGSFCPELSNRRIYISRAKSARKIVNEKDLLPILRNYNFEVVWCEDLGFADQVRLFSEANVVVGPHGAGIFNQMFCNSGADVIEIFNRERWEHAPCRIASIMGHKHWHIYGENRGRNWATWVDPHKLNKVLSYVLEKSSFRNAQDPLYEASF